MRRKFKVHKEKPFTDVVVFSGPVSNIVKIDHLELITNLQLANISGRVVIDLIAYKEFMERPAEVENLSEGTYFILIQSTSKYFLKRLSIIQLVRGEDRLPS